MANILGYGYVTIKDEDEQKPLRELYVKNGASWATVQAAYVKSGSSWIRVFPTPNAIVNFSTTSLNFSTYTTFNSKIETVTVSNTGDEVLTITSIAQSTSDKFTIIGDYSGLGSQLPYTINPGASKTFTVQISGQLVGTALGTVTFVVNKGVLGNQTVTVNLDCETLALFSKAQKNTDSLSIRYDQNGPDTFADFSISNLGNGVLTISSFSSLAGYLNITNTPGGNVTSPGLTLTIPPGGSRSYRANLTAPVKTTYGALTDTLSIISDSVSGTVAIPVNLTIVPHGTVTLTTNAATWPVPFGLDNTVEIEIQAARGGNGGNDSAAGGAGGDGGFYKITADLVFGQTLQFYPGSAGSTGGTTPGTGGSPGGARGTNTLGIGNGGTGGRAGTSGWSGGGGGGGAATIARIVTAVPVANVYVGGGGGGGGGGNRSLGLAANSSFPPSGTPTKALNIDDAGTLSFSLQTQVVEYNTFPTITQPPAATGSTKVIAFGYGFNASGTFTRTVRNNNYVNLTTSTVLTFFARRDTLQSPDSGEDLHLEYSTNGSTWTNITSVSRTVTANTWVTASAQVPSGAKVTNGVLLRFRQSVTGDSNFTNKDLWAISSVWNGSATLQFSGLSGESKSGDGGGGGGGGGGYPGGAGGAVRGGDSGANGGYRGANGIDGSLIYTVLEDKTRAGTPYVKITY